MVPSSLSPPPPNTHLYTTWAPKTSMSLGLLWLGYCQFPPWQLLLRTGSGLTAGRSQTHPSCTCWPPGTPFLEVLPWDPDSLPSWILSVMLSPDSASFLAQVFSEHGLWGVHRSSNPDFQTGSVAPPTVASLGAQLGHLASLVALGAHFCPLQAEAGHPIFSPGFPSNPQCVQKSCSHWPPPLILQENVSNPPSLKG